MTLKSNLPPSDSAAHRGTHRHEYLEGPPPLDGWVAGGSRRGRTIGIVILAVIGGFGVLLAITATVSSGFGGTILVVGLISFILGLGGAVIGRPWWALISSRKTGAALLAGGLVLIVIGGMMLPPAATKSAQAPPQPATPSPVLSASAAPPAETLAPELSAAEVVALIASAKPATALAALGALTVKEALPIAGYDRVQFGPLWADANGNGCDTRNDILARDLTNQQLQPDCVVLSGQLQDPYTSATVAFTRDLTSDGTVEVDSVVTPADAWVKGAQGWDALTRLNFANDPFNLLAVGAQTGVLHHEKDAAGWVPSNVGFQCDYIARQIAVKAKYDLSVTDSERTAAAGILSTCLTEGLPPDTAAIKAAADKQAADAAAAQVAADKQAADVAGSAAAKAAADKQAADAAAAVKAAADKKAADAAAATAVPAPPPPAVVPDSPAPSAYYANCTEARAAGVTPILRGEPGYSSKLDRDDDGIACE